jgi:hypothetical protein
LLITLVALKDRLALQRQECLIAKEIAAKWFENAIKKESRVSQNSIITYIQRVKFLEGGFVVEKQRF